jgi:hypothetical protein
MGKEKVAIPFVDKRTLLHALTKLSRTFAGFLHFNESKGEQASDGESYDLLGKDSNKLATVMMLFKFVDNLNNIANQKSIQIELDRDAAITAAQIEKKLKSEGINIDEALDYSSLVAEMWTHIDNLDKNDIN